MYPVSNTFLAAIRDGGTIITRLEGWYAGAIISGCEDIPIIDGGVEIHSGNGVRRTLTVTIGDANKYAELLSQHGTELRAYRGFIYPDGATELVPLGVFCIDADELDVGMENSTLRITAPDRWAKVMRARFEKPRSSVKTDLIRNSMATLMTEAVPGISVSISATSEEKVGALVWDRDRAGAINDMAANIGAEAYFDVFGQGVIRNVPKLSATVAWQINPGESGMMLSGSVANERQKTYNVVVVYPNYTDGSTPFDPQIAVDNDPNSPTYYLGPMGRVPYFMPTSILKNATSALAAAATRLREVKSRARKMTLESVVNPALDRGDVIESLIKVDYSERHLIIGTRIPLGVEGQQSLEMESSRPTGNVPESE